MRNMKIFPMTALALACSGIGATYATELEEIIVTAQKREQALSEVPIAIQAFTGDSLEEQGLTSTEELLTLIPSASTTSSSTPNNPAITIRGVGTALVGEATTAYYVDELGYSVVGQNVAPPVNFFDLERVEVLRGPQGTLYGLGSLGGAVKYITKDADASAGLSGKVRLWGSEVEGGDGNYGADAVINVPLVEDVLAARVSASMRDIGGFIDDEFGNDNVNTTDFQDIRAKLKWTPSEELEVKIGHWANEVENEYLNIARGDGGPGTFSALVPGVPAIPAVNIDDEISAFAPGTFFNTEFDITNLSISYDLGFATLVNAFSYMEYTQDGAFPFGPQTQTSGLEQETFFNELRLVSNSEGPLQWIGGAFYNKTDLDEFNFQLLSIPGAVFRDVRSSGTNDTTSWAVFGEVSYDLMDGKLTPLFGLRYYEDKREFVDSAQIDLTDDGVFVDSDPDDLLPPTDENAAPDSDETETFESLSPRFNLTYRPSEDGLIYLNIVKGFRSGNFQSFAAASALQEILPEVDQEVEPDQVWSYEVGSKYTLLDGRLVAELAVYYMDWEDRMTGLSVNGNAGLLQNAGDAELYGLDWALTYLTPVEGLVLSFTGNVNSTEITEENPIFANANDPVLREGNRLGGSPAHSYTLSANYETAVSDSLALNLIGSYYHRAEQLDIDAPIFTDEVDILNLRATLSGQGGWGVSLFVKNALDDDGIADSFNRQSFSARPNPREIGLEVTMSFGE